MYTFLKSVMLVGVDETLKSRIQQTIMPLYKEATIALEKNLKTVTANASQMHPTLFIVEWDAVEAYELTKVLQRLRKMPSFRKVPIVGVINAPSPTSLAIAVEYEVSRLILRNNVQTQLPTVFGEIKDSQQDTSPVARRLEELQRARGNVSADAFAAMAENLYKQFPDHPQVQVEYSNVLIMSEKLSDAESLMAKALAANPNNLRVMNSLARVYLRQQKFAEALEILKRAELMSPRNLDRLVLMGDTLRNLHRTGDARIKYEQALEIDGTAKEARQGLGVIELEEGNINQALEFFKDATSPEELAGFFNNAAILAVRRREYEQALRLYESAIESLPSKQLKSRVHFNKGLAFVRWQRPLDAKKEFSAALQLDPSYVRPQQQLAKLERNLAFGAQEPEPVPAILQEPKPPEMPAGGSLLDVPAEAPEPLPTTKITTKDAPTKTYSAFHVEIIEEDEENL